MNELHKLVEKWRTEADEMEVNSLEADSIGLRLASIVSENNSKLLRKRADELQAALAGGGDAVAWVIADPNDVWRFTRYNVNLAAYKDEPGYTVTPLFTHPAGAVQVTDEMARNAARVVARRAGEYFDSLDRVSQSVLVETQRAALTAALNPGGSRES